MVTVARGAEPLLAVVGLGPEVVWPLAVVVVEVVQAVLRLRLRPQGVLVAWLVLAPGLVRG